MSENLHRAVEAAKALRLELARILIGDNGEATEDDQQTLQDTFDGEATTLEAAIRSAVLMIEEDEIFVTGIKARESQLKDRRARLEKRIEATRGLIEQAMTIAQWGKHEMDIGSVTLGKATPRIEIDQEADIPTQFWKPNDPSLDKAGLKKTLMERHKALQAINKLKAEQREAAMKKLDEEMPAVPGAHLETEDISLTIRRS